MIRVLAFIFVLAALAWGIGWIADQPGDVTINWLGYHADTSNVGVALGLLVLVAILLNVVWTVIRFVFRVPSLRGIWSMVSNTVRFSSSRAAWFWAK